ncbi:MAG: type II secretion system F family protein [Pirellulaceae bacterium]
MLFSPRIGRSELISLCDRVSNQLQAGVDARRIWKREAERGRMVHRGKMQIISDGVNAGKSTTEAFNDTGEYFPELFREMVGLGDETGHMDRIFRELGEQYQHQRTLWRAFLAGILWPMIQLGLAILVIGGLIWFMGFIQDMGGSEVDVLGIGLVGTSGALIFFGVIAALFGGLIFLWNLYRRGMFDGLQLDRWVMKIPGIGYAIQTLALSRMAWALALTIGGGMEVRKAIRLSLRASGARNYTQYADEIDQDIVGGEEIYHALNKTGVFPSQFLDAIETGELSGRLSEMMEQLSEQYQQQAKVALNTLAIIAGVVVWLMVMGLIVAVIFRLFFTFYLGPINEALEGF